MCVLFFMALPILSGDFGWNLKMPVYFIWFCFQIRNAKYLNIFLPDTFFLLFAQNFMSFIVHACDISNPVQKFEDFRDWGLRIQQEFVDLYDAEKDL